MDKSLLKPFMQSQRLPTVTAVVLAYGHEPLLESCLEAIFRSRGVAVDLVVVDNGCAPQHVLARIEQRSGARILRPGRNTGFAGGCNLGAKSATGDVIAFVNSDAIVAPDALAKLSETLSDHSVGLASASVRLLDAPATVNSAGNPIHYLGLSWAGGMGEPVADHQWTRDVASASGAVMAARHETWTCLGGFWEELFAYCEDAELSLRCWQNKLRVIYVPEAVALHRYEFSRNPRKLYLMERNRLLLLLTLYQRRTLLALAPAILMFELAVLGVALRQGWGTQKIAGWYWLFRHADRIRARRLKVQRDRRCSDSSMSRILSSRLAPHSGAGMSVPKSVDIVSRAYWRCVRRLI